jgi:hypothetical protein
MNNRKQNSLEWLVDQIKKDTNVRLRGLNLDNLLVQAEVLRKEEIKDAIIYAERDYNILGNVWPTQIVLDKADNYYKETFRI